MRLFEGTVSVCKTLFEGTTLTTLQNSLLLEIPYAPNHMGMTQQNKQDRTRHHLQNFWSSLLLMLIHDVKYTIIYNSSLPILSFSFEGTHK